MHPVKRAFTFCLTIIFSASLLIPAPLYSLAPSSKDPLPASGVTADCWKRFSAPLGSLPSDLPSWLSPLYSDIYTAGKSVNPTSFPVLPFPNMEKGKGVNEPEWVELSLFASSLLELCPDREKKTKLGVLRKKLKNKYNRYRLKFSNERFMDLLNDLKERRFIKGEMNYNFVFDDDDETIVLNISPRMLAVWADFDAVYYIKNDLQKALVNNDVVNVLNDYSDITDKLYLYPIEADYPVLKAIVLLGEKEQRQIKNAISEVYIERERPALIDAIYLLLDPERAEKNWVATQAPNLKDRRIYSVAAEISLLAGGLGRVMQYHGNGLKSLGADVVYIEPMYRKKKDGTPLNSEDYAKLPIPVDDVKKEIELSVIVQGEEARFELWKGVNQKGVPVYLIRDITPRRGLFFVDALYKYDANSREYVSNEQFTEFFTKASMEVVKYLELKRKKELGSNWIPPIVDANDGQALPLTVWQRIWRNTLYDEKKAADRDNEKDIAEIFSEMITCGTTHTYRNRVIIGHDYGLKFLKNAGVPDDWLWVFKRKFSRGASEWDEWDFTGAGVRCADIAKAVSAIHAYEVQDWDPNIELYGVTNGDNRFYSTGAFRKIMEEISIPQKKYDSLTAKEIGRIKRKAKEKLGLNPKQLVLSYSGRLVPEKAGRNNAFTDQNIREMVKAGIQVVIYGNVQPYADSIEISNHYHQLERELASEGHKGRFIFRNYFDINAQIELLAATDIQVQYSDRFSGACEYTEADVTSNGGLQLSPPYWEGIIGKQGISVDWENFTGNTLFPKNTEANSFCELVLYANEQFNKRKGEFLKLQADSLRISRILEATLTSAAYMRLWNSEIDQRSKVQPGSLREITKMAANKIKVIPKDGVKIVNRTEENIKITGDGEVDIEIKLPIYIRPFESINARLVDKYGRRIYFTLKEKGKRSAVFKVTLSSFQLPFFGYVEVTSGIAWSKTPFTISYEEKEDSLRLLEEDISNRVKIKQILPYKRDVSRENAVICDGNEPVILRIEAPVKDEESAQLIVPVLHTNIFGDWDSIGQDKFLFSERGYSEGKLIWDVAFIPERSGEFTLYFTSKTNPSKRVWLAGYGQNIGIRKNGDMQKKNEIKKRAAGLNEIINGIFQGIILPDDAAVRNAVMDSILKEFSNNLKIKGEEEVFALLSLIAQIIDNDITEDISDEVKYKTALVLVNSILKEYKGLAYKEILLLWNKLSETGYRRYFSEIAARIQEIKSKELRDYTSEDSAAAILLSFILGDDFKKIIRFDGVDNFRGVSDGKTLSGFMQNNIVQWKMLKDSEKKVFKGILVQDIKDFGAGVNNWLCSIKKYDINISGVQMVYTLEGLTAEEKGKVLAKKPKNAVFVNNIMDVEGGNVVYLGRLTEQKIKDLKKKNIKLISRGHCGQLLELSFALNLLELNEMYDADGKLSQDVIRYYERFLARMEELSLIDSETFARYTKEIRQFGYIKLPEIKAFEDMYEGSPLVEKSA